MNEWQKKRDELAAHYLKVVAKRYGAEEAFNSGFDACEREMLKSHPVVLLLIEALKMNLLKDVGENHDITICTQPSCVIARSALTAYESAIKE